MPQFCGLTILGVGTGNLSNTRMSDCLGGGCAVSDRRWEQPTTLKRSETRVSALKLSGSVSLFHSGGYYHARKKYVEFFERSRRC
jgi:hypothetical protein